MYRYPQEVVHLVGVKVKVKVALILLAKVWQTLGVLHSPTVLDDTQTPKGLTSLNRIFLRFGKDAGFLYNVICHSAGGLGF